MTKTVKIVKAIERKLGIKLNKISKYGVCDYEGNDFSLLIMVFKSGRTSFSFYDNKTMSSTDFESLEKLYNFLKDK